MCGTLINAGVYLTRFHISTSSLSEDNSSFLSFSLTVTGKDYKSVIITQLKERACRLLRVLSEQELMNLSQQLKAYTISFVRMCVFDLICIMCVCI